MFTTSSQLREKHGKHFCRHRVLTPSSHIVLFYFSVLVIASAIPISCFDESGFLIKRNTFNSFNPRQPHHPPAHVQSSNKSAMINAHELATDFEELLLKSTSDRDMIMIGRVSPSTSTASQVFLVTDLSSSDNANSYPRYSILTKEPKKDSTFTFVPRDSKSASQEPAASIQADQIYVNSRIPNCFIITDASKPVIYTSCGSKSSPESLEEKPISLRPDYIKILSSTNLVALATSPNSSQVSLSLSTNFGDTWANSVQDNIEKLPYQSISDSVKFFENRAYFLRANATTSRTELVAFDMISRQTALIDDNTLAFDLKNEILFYFKNDSREVLFEYKNLTSNHLFPPKRLSKRLYPTTFGKCLDFKLVSVSFDHHRPVFGIVLVHQQKGGVLSELVVVSDQEMWANYKCNSLLTTDSSRNIGIHVQKDQDYFLWNRKGNEGLETRLTKASDPRNHCEHVYASDSGDQHVHLDNFGNVNKLKDQALSSFHFQPDGVLLATKMNKHHQIDGIYSIADLATDSRWQHLLDGHYFYEYSVQDKMIAAVEAIEPTKEIMFSENRGKSWQAYEFSQTALHVKGLVYHDDSSTVTVFCHEPETRKWVLKDIRLSYEQLPTTDEEDDTPIDASAAPVENEESSSDNQDDDPKDSAFDEKVALFVKSNKNAIIVGLTASLLFSFVLVLAILACRSRKNKSIAKHLELFKFHRSKRHESLWRQRFDHGLSLNCFSKFKSSPIHGGQASSGSRLNVDGIDSKAQTNPAFLGSSTRALSASSEILTTSHQSLRFHTVPEDYHPLI